MATEVDISKMMHLSTAHITEGTAMFLCDVNQPTLWNKNLPVPVYDKGGYGFFIFIGSLQGVEDTASEWGEIPGDLDECIHYALERECDWLCLDQDVEPIDDLTTYDL